MQRRITAKAERAQRGLEYAEERRKPRVSETQGFGGGVSAQHLLLWGRRPPNSSEAANGPSASASGAEWLRLVGFDHVTGQGKHAVGASA